MTAIPLYVETKRYFTCPTGCAHKFYVEHLLCDHAPGFAGPWYCDVCGKGWRFDYDADGITRVEQSNDMRMTREEWHLLVMPPQPGPVLFKVQTRRLVDDSDDNARYFYEEHTCVANWLRDVADVQANGELDPHGLCRWVGRYETEADIDRELRAIRLLDQEPV